jgi:hypothetical protein
LQLVDTTLLNELSNEYTNNLYTYDKFEDKYNLKDFTKLDPKLSFSQFKDNIFTLGNTSIKYNDDVTTFNERPIRLELLQSISANESNSYLLLSSQNYNQSYNLGTGKLLKISVNDGVFSTASALDDYVLKNRGKDNFNITSGLVKNIGMGGVTGAIAGSKAGPWGAVGGAVTGVLGGAVNSMMQIGALNAYKADLENNPLLKNTNVSDSTINNIINVDEVYHYTLTLPKDLEQKLNYHFYRYGYNAGARYDSLNNYLDNNY